ncbi:MAG: ABC transporter permease [Acidimicrobiales bacterium]|nr:ABC transporter permease [Acidimicrobiales bacterium]
MTTSISAGTAPDSGDEPKAFRPYSDVEYHFTSDTSSMPNIRQYLKDTWDRRHFVVATAKADLRGPRSRTGLGELWAVADPLFQAGIYWFVISTIRGGGGNQTARLTILISGIFMWALTSTILGAGGRSIIRNKSLVLNTQFPRILLPITEVYKGLLDLGPSLIVYAIIHVLLGAPIGPGVALLPLLIVIQVVMSTGTALIFATLVVFISDMSNTLDYMMRVMFFTTPILFPVSSLGSGLLATVLRVNPFFSLFACFQAVVLGGIPSPSDLAQAIFWACLLMFVGFRLFVSRERGFALRL